jgi:hypothetical protein
MCVNMEEQIITIFRRDTQTIKVTITDSDGSVFNLTGYDTWFTVKKNPTDADAKAVIGPIAGSSTGPTTGVCEFALSVTDTNVSAGTYYFDVQINDGTTDVKTVAYGRIVILQDITVGG